jgi:stress-induced-phosphoprotein 1
MAEAAKARGNAAFSAGRYAEAVDEFTTAIELDPKNHILYRFVAPT